MNYQEKYLKYKSKYLQLKNKLKNQNGGEINLFIPNNQTIIIRNISIIDSTELRNTLTNNGINSSIIKFIYNNSITFSKNLTNDEITKICKIIYDTYNIPDSSAPAPSSAPNGLYTYDEYEDDKANLKPSASTASTSASSAPVPSSAPNGLYTYDEYEDDKADLKPSASTSASYAPAPSSVPNVLFTYDEDEDDEYNNLTQPPSASAPASIPTTNLYDSDLFNIFKLTNLINNIYKKININISKITENDIIKNLLKNFDSILESKSIESLKTEYQNILNTSPLNLIEYQLANILGLKNNNIDLDHNKCTYIIDFWNIHGIIEKKLQELSITDKELIYRCIKKNISNILINGHIVIIIYKPGIYVYGYTITDSNRNISYDLLLDIFFSQEENNIFKDKLNETFFIINTFLNKQKFIAHNDTEKDLIRKIFTRLGNLDEYNKNNEWTNLNEDDKILIINTKKLEIKTIKKENDIIYDKSITAYNRKIFYSEFIFKIEDENLYSTISNIKNYNDLEDISITNHIPSEIDDLIFWIISVSFALLYKDNLSKLFLLTNDTQCIDSTKVQCKNIFKDKPENVLTYTKVTHEDNVFATLNSNLSHYISLLYDILNIEYIDNKFSKISELVERNKFNMIEQKIYEDKIFTNEGGNKISLREKIISSTPWFSFDNNYYLDQHGNINIITGFHFYCLIKHIQCLKYINKSGKCLYDGSMNEEEIYKIINCENKEIEYKSHNTLSDEKVADKKKDINSTNANGLFEVTEYEL